MRHKISVVSTDYGKTPVIITISDISAGSREEAEQRVLKNYKMGSFKIKRGKING